MKVKSLNIEIFIYLYLTNYHLWMIEQLFNKFFF